MDAVLRTFSASPAVRQEVKPLLYLLLVHLDLCSCVTLVFQCGCIQTAFMWMTTCSALQLTGGVILGVALWLRHDPKISTLLGLEYDGNHAPSTFYISTYSCLLHVTCVLTTLCSCLFMNLLFVQVKSHCPASWQQRSKQLKTNPADFPAVIHC